MTMGGILLARLDSSRLPGKQLKEVGGRPMIDYIWERVERIRGLNHIVLATSDRSVDDPLEKWSKSKGIACFRGAAEDVAGRVLSCVRRFSFDAWVRLNCDSPLMDYELFSRGIEIFALGEYDIVTNTFPRSYPVGNSVEVFSTEAFSDGYGKMVKPEYFEHVTSYFYDNPDGYRFYNIKREQGSLQRVDLAVDTPEDLDRYERLIKAMGGDHLAYTGESLVELYDRVVGEKSKALRIENR